MQNTINIKDLLSSLKKNLLFIILIYVVLYILSILIEDYTGYDSSMENIYSEYSIFPIHPIEESNLENNLTFDFISTLDMDPNKIYQKKLYPVDAKKILDDFLISLISKNVNDEIFLKNNLTKSSISKIQKNLSVEVRVNPLSAIVSINMENTDEINDTFYLYISTIVDFTNNKIRALLKENIKTTEYQLKTRVLYLEDLFEYSDQIEKYNLLLQIAKINSANFLTTDFSFLDDLNFIELFLEPKKIVGLKRYNINLKALAILLSTIFSIVLIFLRTKKI